MLESGLDLKRERTRPRTFPYQRLLPYATESSAEALEHLEAIVAQLVVAIDGDELRGVVGQANGGSVTRWTRELKAWLQLKFDMPLATRIQLAKLYYNLALSGVDSPAVERFVGMFCRLTSDDQFQDTVLPQHIDLDWSRLLDQLLSMAFPQAVTTERGAGKLFTTLSRLAQYSRTLFDPSITLKVWERVLPLYNVTKANLSHNVLTVLALMTPTVPRNVDSVVTHPAELLPSVFALWSLQPKSLLYDFGILELLSTLSCDAVASDAVEFTKCGMLTSTQLDVVFSALLRYLEVPVSYNGSPYVASSETIIVKQSSSRESKMLGSPVANFLVFNMIGDLSLAPGGLMDRLEALLNTVSTFCHPSNYGAWSKIIFQTVGKLVEQFVMRWNSQEAGESIIPSHRALTTALRDRFVQSLTEILFMGIQSKDDRIVSTSLTALQGIAYLAPDLVLPAVLHLAYPALQGLGEAHRTQAALRALTVLTRVMCRNKRYAVHLTTLLTLTLPGIDANDLSKTQNALNLFQAVALNAPFADISTGSTALAEQLVAADVAALEECGGVPELPKLPAVFGHGYDEVVQEAKTQLNETSTEPDELILDLALRSSTASFHDLVTLFLGRLFTMLEGLPDAPTSRSRDLPETHIINTIPPTVMAILGSSSPEIYTLVLDQVVDFLSHNLIMSAVDTIAHMCGCLVKHNPEEAFPRLFPLLYTRIKHEVLENGAGATRSGADILPRDRALLWYLSALTMSLTHAHRSVLPFGDQLLELTLLLRAHCKGTLAYSTANAVHHTLTTLVSIYVTDYRGYEGTPTSSTWGEYVDLNSISISWHVPTRPEVEFAVRFYEQHCETSIENLRALLLQDTRVSMTERSDRISSNLACLRTATCGISLLVDPEFDQDSRGASESSSDHLVTENESMEEDTNSDGSDMGPIDVEAVVVDDVDDDPEGDGGEGEIMEMRKFRLYSTGYFFIDKSDPLYVHVHNLRRKVGSALHDTFVHLSTHHESDLAAFKALMHAVKIWFSDLGIERSAKALEAYVAMYNYDTRNYRLPGTRKDFPRPILTRRAFLYQYERLDHNMSPRQSSELERTLLQDVVSAALSIYPDIRRHAQAALDTAARVLVKARDVVYPIIVRDLRQALDDQDFIRANSGMKALRSRQVNGPLKRASKYLVEFVSILREAMDADYEQLNTTAVEVFHALVPSLRLPLDTATVSRHVLDGLESLRAVLPPDQAEATQARIDSLRKKRMVRRQHAADSLHRTVEKLARLPQDVHWKLEAAIESVFLACCTAPQFVVAPIVATRLSHNVRNPHPGLRLLTLHTLFKVLLTRFKLAQSNYYYDQFLLGHDNDEETLINQVQIESSGNDFTAQFEREMANTEAPAYFLDRHRTGWLVWSDVVYGESVVPKQRYMFDAADSALVAALRSMMTTDWMHATVLAYTDETKGDNEHFDMMNAVYFAYMVRLLEYSDDEDTCTLDEFLAIAKSTFKPDEKGSHRCLAEIMVALTDTLRVSASAANLSAKLAFMEDMFSQVVTYHLNHENVSYWYQYVTQTAGTDHRRLWPVYKVFFDFRLKWEAASATVFKDSSRLGLTRKLVSASSWTLQHTQPVLDNCWANMAYPLQGVRDEVAKLLAAVYKGRYHLSYQSTRKFVEDNARAGDLGLELYKMDAELEAGLFAAFEQLEKWRVEREDSLGSIGTDSTSHPYILASKTLTIFLERLFKTAYGVALVPQLPGVIVPALLHMLNVREVPELPLGAVNLFKLMGNIVYPTRHLGLMISMIEVTAIQSTKWHQRLSILSFTQAFFFRQMFVMSEAERQTLVNTVVGLLKDPQLEVRQNAAETLAGMVRCSNSAEQELLTAGLTKNLTAVLRSTKPVRQKRDANAAVTEVARHSAVLGLGALVQAFPYKSPPPPWVPGVLATLATRAATDIGAVGVSVKAVLSDFKKTRQDTWHIDSKVFSQEQLEDLEGVLWKNYFV